MSEDYGFDSSDISSAGGNHHHADAGAASWSCCGRPCGSCVVNRSWRDLTERNGRLCRVMLVLVVLSNVPYGNYALWPCVLFSTWIHESCHALAALSVGGSVAWLNVYADGSGLAYTSIPVGDGLAEFRRCWVAAAGYCGTAVVGGVLLTLRSGGATHARAGTGLLAACLLASCACWVRNVFGAVAVGALGTSLGLAAWWASPFWIGELFAGLAATTCLNALTSIRVLYSPDEATVGGQVKPSDASTLQDVTDVPYYVWATVFLAVAVFCTVTGVLVQLESPDGNRNGNDTTDEHDEETNVALVHSHVELS